ncbi:MAG: S-layer homology domain-containing protein [Actinomycetota bacterium]
MPRSLAAIAICAVLTAGLATAPASAAPLYPQDWALAFDGWNRSSSPLIADIDADGQNEIVVGHQDGLLRAYEANGTLKWSTPAVPGVNAGCNAQTTATAIDSSPAIGDLDLDGTPEIVVGVGSTWVANQNGGVIAFDGVTGAIEWRTALGRDMGDVWDNSPVKDGWCEGVYSTPAIGDVDGDGYPDVSFASFDFYIWSVDRNGDPLPGFPFNNDDSVWSSPALFDIDADGDMEIFIGGDTTPGGYYDHLGGVLRALDWTPGGVVNLWNAEANEVFHSSGAIGDINGDGRMEIVIGTGNNWYLECGAGHPQCGPGDGSDTSRVFAFHLHDGSTVPGFPVSTGGTVIGSPALGDVDGDGQVEVVVGSADTHVYAWNGDGSLLWRVQPDHAHFPAQPFGGGVIIADLQGDGGQDVALGSAAAMILLDGATGASLEGSLPWQDRTGFSRSYEAAPAVGVLGGERKLVLSAFDTPNNTSRLAVYDLPASPGEDDWPMFGRDASRSGNADPDATVCGFSQSGTFCDVFATAFYYDAVTWMVSEGITNGVSNYLFGPNQTLTRAQMVTFLWREAGSPSGNPAHGFTDVPAGSWYDQAVAWAKANGITTGTSPTTFSPNDDVTRGQLVTLLWRREGSPGATASEEFLDVPAGRYFTPAVGWAKANGVTNGTSPTTFAPDDPVTRGQAAAFLFRADDD